MKPESLMRQFKSVAIPSEYIGGERSGIPETPMRHIAVRGLSNVWIKDESVHAMSGTHKDRLAWDAIGIYRQMLATGHSRVLLPHFSLISSGSAAIAIGRTLHLYDFPKLKVLVDEKLDKTIVRKMLNSHCEVYQIDLSKRVLSERDVLALTRNQDGLELTSHKDIVTANGSYDSLAIDVVNQDPDYLFVPFGTGVTYKKIFSRALQIATNGSGVGSPAYHGDPLRLRSCNFIGVTTSDPRSIADKLFAPHSPFQQIRRDQIEFYKQMGVCGALTGIVTVEDKYIREAMDVAQENGIHCEPSGIAGLAKMLEMKKDIPCDAKIIIVNTGKLKI